MSHRKIEELNKIELNKKIFDHRQSWHHDYRDSAVIFIGNLDPATTEEDILRVFSQYGEIEHINLVKNRETSKSKGFCFVIYHDQRSTILAVDNFNGIKIGSNTIKVDHVLDYKPAKSGRKDFFGNEILKKP